MHRTLLIIAAVAVQSAKLGVLCITQANVFTFNVKHCFFCLFLGLFYFFALFFLSQAVRVSSLPCWQNAARRTCSRCVAVSLAEIVRLDSLLSCHRKKFWMKGKCRSLHQVQHTKWSFWNENKKQWWGHCFAFWIIMWHSCLRFSSHLPAIRWWHTDTGTTTVPLSFTNPGGQDEADRLKATLQIQVMSSQPGPTRLKSFRTASKFLCSFGIEILFVFYSIPYTIRNSTRKMRK